MLRCNANTKITFGTESNRDLMNLNLIGKSVSLPSPAHCKKTKKKQRPARSTIVKPITL